MNNINLKSAIIWVIFAITIIAYSNHFNNEFHFDDNHTIVNNAFIRSIKNIPLFFKDGSTSSVLPQNQSYRPVVSTTLAIDYWMAKGYTPFYYHLSMFLIFLLQGLLIFLFMYKLLDSVSSNDSKFYIAAATTCWYLVHPAIAETVNYVIARSDILSTFFVMVAFVLFQYSKTCRKYFLYLIPVALGALAKPPSVLFAPLLFLYILFFDENVGLTQIFEKRNWTKTFKVIKGVLIPFFFCVFLYIFIDKMTPATWVPGGTSRIDYLITQPFVILHYCITFFLPFELSADSDWTILPSVWDIRFFVGVFFLLTLIFIGLWFANDKSKRPISFGIFWFLLTLVPTSSVIPLAEVLNDHRMFFPFIGLSLSVTYSIYLFIIKPMVDHNLFSNNRKYFLVFTIALLTFGYAYGTHQRNKVWRSEESLLLDVTKKSPKNGRGLMNYGLEKMSKGKYNEANDYFHRALVYNPYYHYLFINLGILYDAIGKPDSSDYYYKKAIEYGANFANAHYYYGKYLKSKKNYQNAINEINKAISMSPGSFDYRIELLDIYDKARNWQELNVLAQSSLQLFPDNPDIKNYLYHATIKKNTLDLNAENVAKNPTPEKLLDLSLQYYNDGKFQDCVDQATKATLLKPDYVDAYNNIGAGYIALNELDKAIPPLEKAISLKSDYTLAINNLNFAKSKISNKKGNANITGRSAENYIEQSLNYYNQKEYSKCIESCYKALEIKPNFDIAYNNICASYNQLKQWDKSITAGKKGLSLNPNNQLLRNNLQVAIDAKAASK